VSSKKKSLSIALWHPFTARSIGWSQEQLVQSHSRPHVAALRHLAQEMGANCRVEYLSDRKFPSQVVIDAVEWRYWPRSFRFIRGSDRFRHEWSLRGLLATALNPADITIINTSGHGGPFSRMLALAVRACGRAYIAMIGGLHATVAGAQYSYFDGATAIVVHNTVLRDKLVTKGIPAAKLVVLPLGVDTDLFSPDESEPAVLESPMLLFVGRLDALKGVETLIRALAVVRAEHPGVTLRIVGPSPTPEYLVQLKQIVGELSLTEAVAFIGAVPYEALPKFYRAATLLILPSSAEGFGMVVVESMACGTPVIAIQKSGGPADIITDNLDGRLVDASNLAEEIVSLLNNPTKLLSMGIEARRTSLARYSDAATAKSFRNLVSRAPLLPDPH